MAQQIIWDASERSLSLNDVPGLLPIDRVNPKTDASENTRVTQNHGSLEGKNVLSMAETIRIDKDNKKKAKEEPKNKK